MKPLLTIAGPNPDFPRDALDAPGGFAWWYTDMLDADLNGMVLIWSFGLPFLPGYASAARRGAGQLPRTRPSLNVAIFERGRLVCYLLNEFGPDEVEWNEDSWKFGDSSFATTLAEGHRTLKVALDCALPGGQRLRGSVELEGVARLPRSEDSATARHDWAPFTGPTKTRIDLAAGPDRYRFAAPGYFDGNVGQGSLSDAGIDSWMWGRICTPERQKIYYVLWGTDGKPEAHGIEIDASGSLTRFGLDVDITQTKRGLAGLRFPSTVQLSHAGAPWLTAATTHLLDDGPFYVRQIIDTPDGRGIGEFCRTDRIDLARHRPLVNMRVQRADGANSMWLPLFAGPKRGRLGRLLAQFGA